MRRKAQLLTSTYTLAVPDIAKAVLAGRARERQQKDELCGAFWAAVAVSALTGTAVTQDDAAVAAGTLLSSGGGSPDDLPPGAAGRTDYIREIATTADTELAGTSPRGLVRAIGSVSGGALTAVPLRGPWWEKTVEALADFVLDGGNAVAILNVATRYLWDSHLSPLDVTTYLDGGDDNYPDSEWQVGHFVAVAGSLAADVIGGRRVLLCADTYPSLGVAGLHPQPAARLAAALNRDGAATSGGAIIVVPSDRAASVQAWAAEAGVAVGYWDNGVPDTRDEEN
jgi:hypothetical protein